MIVIRPNEGWTMKHRLSDEQIIGMIKEYNAGDMPWLRPCLRHTSAVGIPASCSFFMAPTVYANLNRSTRPASLELRKGSAELALITNLTSERNRNGFCT